MRKYPKKRAINYRKEIKNQDKLLVLDNPDAREGNFLNKMGNKPNIVDNM